MVHEKSYEDLLLMNLDSSKLSTLPRNRDLQICQ